MSENEFNEFNELEDDIYLNELNEINEINEINDINEINEDEELNSKVRISKNKSDLDNDDNLNDYIEDDDTDDPDFNDETYDVDDEDDGNKTNLVHFMDNELDNDSKMQYIIKNEDKITSNIITIYEMTELIGIRATQISNNSPIFVEVEELTDPIEMAKKEIINNKCPLYIKRYIGLDKYELWNPNEMIKLNL